jgi:hypothetical protein
MPNFRLEETPIFKNENFIFIQMIFYKEKNFLKKILIIRAHYAVMIMNLTVEIIKNLI